MVGGAKELDAYILEIGVNEDEAPTKRSPQSRRRAKRRRLKSVERKWNLLQNWLSSARSLREEEGADGPGKCVHIGEEDTLWNEVSSDKQ